MDYDDEEAQIAEAIRLSLEESQTAASGASPPLLSYQQFLVPPLEPSIPQQPKPSVLIDLTDDDKIVKIEGEKTIVRKLRTSDANEEGQPEQSASTTFDKRYSTGSDGAGVSSFNNARPYDNTNDLINSYQGRILDSYRDDDYDDAFSDSFGEDMDTSFIEEVYGQHGPRNDQNDEEDEELKRALALSLTETAAQFIPGSSSILGSNCSSQNASKTKPKVVKASPLSSLDREKMEKERLERIRKREKHEEGGTSMDKPKRYRIHEMTPEPKSPTTTILSSTSMPRLQSPAIPSTYTSRPIEPLAMDHPTSPSPKVYPRRSKKAAAKTPTSPPYHSPPTFTGYPSSPPSTRQYITSPKSPSVMTSPSISGTLESVRFHVKSEPQETPSSPKAANSGASHSFSGFPEPLQLRVKTEPQSTTSSRTISTATSPSFSGFPESTQSRFKAEPQEQKLSTSTITSSMASESRSSDEVYLPRFNVATFRNTYIKGTIPGKFEIRIQDLLVKEHIVKAVMTTYQLDEVWLDKYLPSHIPQCLVVHWDKKSENAGFNTIDKVTTVHPPLNGYGTFHPKLMLVFYPTFCRVVVSSANLVDYDWDQLVNTVYVQDFALRPTAVENPEDLGAFGSALHNYLKVMTLPEKILSVVKCVDFSTAKVLLLPSVQGSYPVNAPHTYGLAQLSKILHTKGLQNKEMELEYQTSSLGKLKLILLDELYRSSRGLPVRGRSRFKDEERLPPIKVIFPTDSHVHGSRLGELGAGTVCHREEYWKDATYPKRVMHDFECVGNLKRSLMHSKLILAKVARPTNHMEPVIPAQGAISALRHQDSNCVGWFYVGSANLSESAWGTVANKKPAPNCPEGGLHVSMRNWELGIVYIIETEDEMHDLAALSAAQRLDPSGEQSFFGPLPVPYKRPLKPYSFGDRPWFY
ncbi:hypothetical protein BGZ76_007205 [Entomortierella beljakovae]|nr:hypothetical protein BGZ76_007205 [Entomortierella beljakovae]